MTSTTKTLPIDRARFLAWLLAVAPERTFVPRMAQGCPLQEFLREILQTRSVAVWQTVVSLQYFTDEVLALPGWAQRDIARLDTHTEKLTGAEIHALLTEEPLSAP
jgi:hypothetical protein